MPEGSLGSLFLRSRAVIPPGLLFALGLLSTDGWGQIFLKWPPPEKGTAAEYSLELCLSMSFPHNKPHSPLLTPGCPPRTAVRFDPDSYGDLALPWDPVHVKVCVCLLRMGSPFPPVLWCSCSQAPLAFNARCSRGSFSQCQIQAHEGLLWGSELSLL